MASSTTVAEPDLGSVRARLPELMPAGVGRLELTDPVDALMDSRASSDALHLIRDATGHGLRVDWTLGAAPEDLSNLVHLWPPSAYVDAGSAEAVNAWRESYSFGQCFFRVGPSFVSVKDIRPHLDAARMVIEDQDADTFLALAEQRPPAAGEQAAEAAIADLAEADLCLVGTDGVFVLPYRIKRWPVPFSAI
jgi:hypothetical protein